MKSMAKEIYDAFLEAGVSQERAEDAAAVVPPIDNLATKTQLVELRHDMTKMESGIRGDMTKMEAGLREDMSKMEMRLIKWMVSLQATTLAMIIALFIKFL